MIYKSNMQINKTTIIFDNQLINFMSMMEYEMYNDLGKLRSNDCQEILLVQDKMRKWFIDHQSMLNYEQHTKKKMSMPNIFALMSLNICHYNSFSKWEDVFKSIHDYYRQTKDTLNFCDLNTDNALMKCCCGHDVHSESTYNIRGNKCYHMVVGSDCGAKFNIMSRRKFNSLRKPECYRILSNRRI